MFEGCDRKRGSDVATRRKEEKKKGITDEDINKRIDELNNIIAECKEVARKHPPINKNV